MKNDDTTPTTSDLADVMTDVKTDVDEAVENQPRMRQVMIACPSYDGRVGVFWTNALSETIKIGLVNGIDISPYFVAYDALIQRARNDIFKAAYDSGVDDLLFIDSDVDWNPVDVFRILSHDAPIVAAPVVKKGDVETYSVKLTGRWEVHENGLVPVEGVATGFMRVRRDAIEQIWDASEEYVEWGRGIPKRMVFEVKLIDGDLWSEDIVFCDKWRRLGGTVYVDPLINCGHTGDKRWISNFYEWTKVHGLR